MERKKCPSFVLSNMVAMSPVCLAEFKFELNKRISSSIALAHFECSVTMCVYCIGQHMHRITKSSISQQCLRSLPRPQTAAIVPPLSARRRCLCPQMTLSIFKKQKNVLKLTWKYKKPFRQKMLGALNKSLREKGGIKELGSTKTILYLEF